MAKKYLGYIRIDDRGAGFWASQKDRDSVDAALSAAQRCCRVRLLSLTDILNAAHTAERRAITKNLRAFAPTFHFSAEYERMPSAYHGQPYCTWVVLKRTAPRTWAVISVFRDWLPPTEESGRFFRLEKEEFEEWQRKLPLFLGVGVA